MSVKTALGNWDLTIRRVTAVFDGLDDEQLLEEIAPGKNRAIYLLGHLAAVHDAMLPLLGLGERQYPHLDDPFIKNPDRTIPVLPPPAELRACWKKTNELLSQKFLSLKPEQWLERHTMVSEVDFAREPHRNRLNVLLSRTGHASYHHGQLALLKK